jgi:hypothetical protein
VEPLRRRTGVYNHDLIGGSQAGGELTWPEREADDRLAGHETRSARELTQRDELAGYQAYGRDFAHNAIPLRRGNGVQRGID